MFKKEMKKAEDAENDNDYELAHSLYAMLAHKCRKLRYVKWAEFFNTRAGVYAPSDKDQHANGYIVDSLEDDE